jgi:hypothetical protein
MKRQLSRVSVKLCLVQESQQNRGAEKKQEAGVSGVDPLFSVLSSLSVRGVSDQRKWEMK